MPHMYRCPTCKAVKFYELNNRPFLQPACDTPQCMGRLVHEETTPGPVPPAAAPPVLSAGDIAYATRPKSFTNAGTYCTYQLDEDRRDYKITFRGNTIADPTTVYQFTLDGQSAGAGYQIPAYADMDDPTSHRFVKNSAGSQDFALPPNPLPENRMKGVVQRGVNPVLSFGHGNGLQSPIRVQIGSQHVDNEHSGSGLIHIMFAHNKTDIASVEQLLQSILRPSNIGAIYKTKNLEFGFYRIIFLNRAAQPYRLVTELQPGFLRLITVFKPGASSGDYNQFRSKPDKYSCLYSWDKDKY